MTAGARSEEGAALVEFSLVAGLLVFLLLAIIELSLLLNAQLVLSAAAREGARLAAVDGGATAAVARRIEEALRLGRVDPRQAEVRVAPRRSRYGGTVRVSIRYPYPLMTAAIRAVAGDRVWLAAAAVARGERLR